MVASLTAFYKKERCSAYVRSEVICFFKRRSQEASPSKKQTEKVSTEASVILFISASDFSMSSSDKD